MHHTRTEPCGPKCCQSTSAGFTIVLFLCFAHFTASHINMHTSAPTTGSSTYPASFSHGSTFPSMVVISTPTTTITAATRIHKTARTQNEMMVPLVAVGARVSSRSAAVFLRSRAMSMRRVRFWMRVMRNMHGAESRESRNVLNEASRTTKDDRIMDAQISCSIWRESAEKGLFSVCTIGASALF
ncbi:hypothetical protein BDN70DRAFT_247879 [Pholiota conissans]|uniref:Uncharacterized protein n=1 Tax=Pholiota conissans TaxID=109636 RepID=A0A9P5YU66_9AGAR|nr:hypothetical protein BDN70DRAFT_247879 [Pholiota conissans]